MVNTVNTEFREKWERCIAIFWSSGQTQVEWCKINNLNLHHTSVALIESNDSKYLKYSICRVIPVQIQRKGYTHRQEYTNFIIW